MSIGSGRWSAVHVALLSQSRRGGSCVWGCSPCGQATCLAITGQFVHVARAMCGARAHMLLDPREMPRSSFEGVSHRGVRRRLGPTAACNVAVTPATSRTQPPLHKPQPFPAKLADQNRSSCSAAGSRCVLCATELERTPLPAYGVITRICLVVADACVKST